MRDVALLLSLIICVCAVGCGGPDVSSPQARAGEAAALRAMFADATGGSNGTNGGGSDVGSGWATLKGRFVYDGQAPTPQPRKGFNPKSNERAICSPGGQTPLDFSLLVGDGGGISNVAIFLRKAPRVHESASAAPAEPPVFDQKQCVFVTHVFACRVGHPVILKNSDNVGHNAKIGGKASFNETIEGGEQTEFTAKREEALPVDLVCSIHPWMKAYFLPRENGYYFVTGEDGNFEIPNLPAGVELELQVWHERGTGTGKGLSLETDQAKKLKWSKRGRFKVTLTEGQPMDLGDILVPGSALSG